MKHRSPIVAPSILAADFSKLGEQVKAVEDGGAEWLHIDVMDGVFVPNISFGFPIMQSLRPHTKLLFDVHLMLANVEPYLHQFVAAGADSITVHAEAGPHLHRNLQTIRALKRRTGVAINPGTSVSVIVPVLELVDMILIMTVNPGFGGQSFIPTSLDKIRQARALVADRNIDIQVDGGITTETAGPAFQAGANVLVAGSAIFKGQPAHEIAAIRTACAVTA